MLRAVENLETTKTELDKELSRLRVQFKQLELKLRSLEANLEQKVTFELLLVSTY